MRIPRLAAVTVVGALTAAACAGPDPAPTTEPEDEPVPEEDPAPDEEAPPDEEPEADEPDDEIERRDVDPAAEPAAGWRLTGVDTGIKPEVALDATGGPAIAYLLEEKRGYVRFAAEADGWAPEQVARGYFYGPLDLDVDPDGRPHVVWHDHEDVRFRDELGNLAHAVRDDDGWQVQAAEDDGHDGWDSAVAVAPDGTVHAAGVDPSQFGREDGIEHYRLGDDGFQVTSIGSGPIEYEWNVGLAIDPDGEPAMSYFDDRDPRLVYAEHVDGDWIHETVVADGDVGRFSSLAFDADGSPHITFFEVTGEPGGETTGTVHYAVRDDGTWTVEQVAELSDVEIGRLGARRITAVAIDPDGTPRVAFTDRSGLWYGVRGGDGWEVEQVLTATDRPLGQQASLVVDADGRSHLATYELTDTEAPLQGVVLHLTPEGEQ